MMLVLGKASKGRQTLTLANFIQALRAPDLDSMTKPPITFAEPAPFWHHTLFSFRGNVSAAAESRIGSASAPDICCNKPTGSAAKDAAGESKPPNRDLRGSVDLSGPKGEYVTGGESFHILSPGTPCLKRKIERLKEGDIAIRDRVIETASCLAGADRTQTSAA
jgi:hypothetical protein